MGRTVRDESHRYTEWEQAGVLADPAARHQ